MRRGSPARRLYLTLACIVAAMAVLGGRLVQMQGVDTGYYRTEAASHWLKTIPIPAARGSVTASNGAMLAMTVQTDVVFADPVQISQANRAQYAARLAGPLKMTQQAILDLIDHPTSPQYVVLAKSVSAALASRIAAMNLTGIAMTPSYSTIYPDGDLAADVVGFTDHNASGSLVGEAGVEQQFNKLLAGRPGSRVVETGPNQVPVPLSQASIRPAVPASNLRLTIQPDIQYEAEQQCKLRLEQTGARSCSVVVMQPATGRILAIAQWPTYNPAAPASLRATNDIGVANVFAPGSTLKVVTVAAALERGGQTPMSPYTVPYQINIGGYQFHDAEFHPTVRYTIAGVLAHSSNVGMVQVAGHISPQVQYQYLRAFGLGALSGVGLPGESAGLLPRPGTPNYYGDDRYEYAFGQGLGVTAIQMASIYATIANGGVRVQPTIVAGTTNTAGVFRAARPSPRRRVIQVSTARALMKILQQVPYVDEQAAEPWGLIAGYPVAAKTGTAQVSDPGLGTCLCKYGSSYIGIAPANNPKLVVAVNIQDPARGYYGDVVAGPVFYNVMRFALQTLQIPPTRAKRPYIRLTAP